MKSEIEKKKESAVEEALKLKSEGKKLSYIIGKFPEQEFEIREVFGIAGYLAENRNSIEAPKNVLKTILSKLPSQSPANQINPKSAIPPAERIFSKDNFTRRENKFLKQEEHEGKEKTASLGEKWKIILAIIIMASIPLFFLMKKNSEQEDFINVAPTVDVEEAIGASSSENAGEPDSDSIE